MERYICIHGHFYQPPRENAWLEDVEVQDSAYPYHDWNERITAECYATNGASRIQDGEGFITKIVNNYAKISFDFGPTLMSWMKEKAPGVYQSILDADRQSMDRFYGHGSAIALAYNHIIMPLANHRDRYTQVVWGIRDFESRFGRKPEGMWLPETAVDLDTLDILAGQGIRFTILAPHQARQVRRKDSETWQDVAGGRIDPSMPYEARLPSGRSIALFFYDEPIARAVAFEGLLSSGERYAQRLFSAFSDRRNWSQLVNIATDGESYGHHHRFGDMALAYALNQIEKNETVELTNYGEYLDIYSPTFEVQIIENTSWSCAHGVERWRSNCGDNTGAHPGWNQEWRKPLREAMDWLRDTLAPKYEGKAREFLKDPWAARDDYINVILDRSPENVQRFLDRHATRGLSEAEQVTVLRLLELQRHAMLMFTSCGWFFDDLAGIETVQVIQYAGRAVQLAEQLFGEPIEPRFLELLARAKSNVPEKGDGRTIYEKNVRPAMVDLTLVAAHYAISSIFEEYEKQARVYCYQVERQDEHNEECGRSHLKLGRVAVSSEITREKGVFSFGSLYFGDHAVSAGVCPYQDEAAYNRMLQRVKPIFCGADFPQTLRILDRYFGEHTYSIRSLFRDEQRQVVSYILEASMADAETEYRQLYRQYYPLMRFLRDINNPFPTAFTATAEFVLNADLGKAVSSSPLDVKRVRDLLADASLFQIKLDRVGLGYELQKNLEQMMSSFAATPGDINLLAQLVDVASLVRSSPFNVNLWQVQNLYYKLLHSIYRERQVSVRNGDELAKKWLDRFAALGDQLRVKATE